LRFNGLVKSAVLSDDRTRILTVFDDSDDDRGVYSTAGQVWDAATGAPIGKPLKRDYPIWSIAFSADGKRVAAAFKEKNAQVWDAVTGVPISRTVQHDRIVTSVAFSPDGRRVVTASEDKSARVWNARPSPPTSSQPRAKCWATTTHFRPFGALRRRHQGPDLRAGCARARPEADDRPVIPGSASVIKSQELYRG
jgi:WD40 repeat protein